MVLQGESCTEVEGAFSVEWRIPLITIVDDDERFRKVTDSLVRSAGYRRVMF
jgi:hypothetical protein